ncbi:MAG: hypothetical protein JXQ73_07420 [Phycisphaerae bacterium]|nr:hypothetical protein [Phycisphaerae bacterium]
MRPAVAAVPQSQESWPSVIGIIAIIFGVGGILSSVMGLASTFTTDWMLTSFGATMPAEARAQMQVAKDSAVYIAVGLAVALAIAPVLLAGGIGLLKQRRWSPKVLVSWAGARMLLVLVNTIFAYTMVESQLQQTMQQDPNLPQMPAAFVQGIGTFSVCGGLVWGWALPVFMLIWFSRGKIRAQTAQWV